MGDTISSEKQVSSLEQQQQRKDNDTATLSDNPEVSEGEGEAEMSYEEAETKISASLQYLKNCDNYSTGEAMCQINQLAVVSNICGSLNTEDETKLADHLINEEFAQVFVKIVKSLHDDDDSEYDDGGQKEQCLGDIKGACTSFTCGPNFHEVRLALTRHGAVALLLEGLNASNQIETDCELTSTIDTLYILYNCVTNPDSIVRTIYRKANAVPILMKYLKSHEMMVTMASLSILARIVNDEESDLLASTEGCIEHLVTMLSKAVSSDDGWVRYQIAGTTYGDRVYGLIDTMNHLAINDCNKKEILKHGGVPIVVQIITNDTSTTEEITHAIETLWKIVFNNKGHLQTLNTALKDANASQGKCDTATYVSTKQILTKISNLTTLP